MSDVSVPDLNPVRQYLLDLQQQICDALEQQDGTARFERRILDRPLGASSRPAVIGDGPVIEKAAVHFSHSVGQSLPPAATTRRPELQGQGYQAVSVSLIVHPRNPMAPTCHANFRCFGTDGKGGEAAWWFGGGYDLTPYYGFEEDARHWHCTAKRACDSIDPALYPRFKQACDGYFHLPHRDEPRGVGGLFYDDYADGSFNDCFKLTQTIADSFLVAYVPILERRKQTPYGERERNFQLYRRGRYVEFNLLYDRGTRFGLQARGRAESILASLPPLVRWDYDWSPEPGSEEARLYSDFLRPRDWAAEADGDSA